MSAKRKTSPVQRQVQYDPCQEKTNGEQVAAANWELLRRIPAFQETAKQWTASSEFRQQHVSSRGTYAKNDPARCSLDWMLTPAERQRLAIFQTTHRLLFWPDSSGPNAVEWNFGPIIIEWDWGAQDGWLSKSIDKIVRIRAVNECADPLTLATNWTDAPARFKEQFRQATIGGSLLKEVKLLEIGEILAKLGNALLAGEALSKEDQLALGQYLFRQGNSLRAIDQNFKLAALPRVFMDERKLDETLGQIKAGLRFLRRTGHDWNTKKSFLGTPNQWRRFLAWEAHRENAYKAAAEFLREDDSRLTNRKGKQGEPSRSEIQRDIAGSINTAVQAIKSWFPRLYPDRDLEPHPKQKKVTG